MLGFLTHLQDQVATWQAVVEFSQMAGSAKVRAGMEGSGGGGGGGRQRLWEIKPRLESA